MERETIMWSPTASWLVVGVEHGLVGLGPFAVDRFNLVAAFEGHELIEEVEAVHGMVDRHLGNEDLFVAAGHFQVAMAVVGLQQDRCLGFSVTSSSRSTAMLLCVMSKSDILPSRWSYSGSSQY